MNNLTPLVSVITPTYNSANFILDSIESVKNQSFKNWELIIVDDCSTDNTVSIIKEQVRGDSRISIIENDINSGAAKSRNKAIDISKGKYIAFLDSDDLWFTDKLTKQVHFMEEHQIAFSFSSYEIIDENGNNLNKVINVPDKITYNQLLKNTIIGCLTVMLDVSKIGKVSMPDIRARQDTAMWLKILKTGVVAYGIGEPLARYRKVNNSVSSNKYKMVYKTWRMYRDIEKLNIIKATYFFLNYAFNALKKSRL